MRKLLLFLSAIVVSMMISAQDRPDPQPAADTYEKFKVGMAGYTFVNFDLDKTLQTLEKCDVHYLCIKDFHLPFNSTDQQIADFHEKLKSKGVTGYAVGPIYMKTEQEIDNAFEYAKRVGVKLIVGVPNYDLLPYLDKKVKEYDFNYAIHLHGPDMPLYPDADDVWENVKDLDPRIGMCLDIGHEDAPKNRLRRRRQFGARTQHEGSVHRNCRIHRLFQGRGSHNERQTKIKDNFILSLSRKGLCSDANAIPFFYDI